MRALTRVALWFLLLPILILAWYWIVRAEYYFPDRYEDAFFATAMALMMVMPTMLFLIGRSIFLVYDASRKRRIKLARH